MHKTFLRVPPHNHFLYPTCLSFFHLNKVNQLFFYQHVISFLISSLLKTYILFPTVFLKSYCIISKSFCYMFKLESSTLKTLILVKLRSRQLGSLFTLAFYKLVRLNISGNFFKTFVFLMCVLVPQSCLSLCNSMDYSPPGSSVRGILQARILKWVATSFS